MAPAEEPLYLIQTRVFTPEGATVLIPTPTLDGPLDYSRVLEQPGGGVLYPDPTAMVVTGRMSLVAAEREGFFTSFGAAVVRPDGVYFPAQWYVDPDWDRVPQGSLLVRIDATTDEVTMTSDTRCTSMM